MLLFVTGAIWLYILWRFVWPLRLRPAARISLALVLLLVSQYHQITRRFFGSLASPEVPHALLVGLSWAFGVFLLLALLLLLRDVVGALVFLAARRVGRRILTGRALLQSIGPLAMVLSGLGVWEAVRVPDVKTIQITVPGLPQAFDGYRIAQLTDLHASRLLNEPWIEAVVARTNAQAPDLTVITGDIADGTPAERADDVHALADLRAHDGVLAIPGNHEYYADYQGWMKAYRNLGLTMLENKHVVIHRGQAGLAIVGITDSQARRFGQPPPDLSAALKGLKPDTPMILLSHRPGGAAQNAQAGVALQLSGHTHGGQILGPHLLTQWANEGYVSGLYKVGAMQLYVSNGTGLWGGLAIRLGRPSEITLITLRAPTQ
ncbi:MAG: metallophosphoesterase [Alcaligenaceae bacterium]|nr:metallophosphoesterase [Alcaligenaceae bacterium]